MSDPIADTTAITVTLTALEYVAGSSDKFYRVFTVGDQVTAQYGRNGTYGVFTPRKAGGVAAAAKAVAGKAAKGYQTTRTGETTFTHDPSEADLDAWASGVPNGAVLPVTVPSERGQSPVVARANAAEVDPALLSRVRTALATTVPAVAHDPEPVAPLPMLAENVQPGDLESLLDDDRWVMQPKLDGDRVLVQVSNGQVAAFGRNGQPKVTNVSQAMLDPFHHLTEGHWLFDGEVVGRTLWLFDLIQSPGFVTPATPFATRSAALAVILGVLAYDRETVRFLSVTVTSAGKRNALAEAEDGRKEGIILRRADSPYTVGRADHLLRHKFVKTLDAEVISTGSGEGVLSYRATFTPQAWIRDYAVDVDAEGETTWTVSAGFVADAARIVTADPDFGLDSDDVLKSDPDAPAWARDWHGPFSITVEQVTTPGTGKQSAALAVYDHDGEQVRIGNVTTIGKGGPGGIQVGQVVEVAFLYVVNPEHPVLYQPRILRVRTDKGAAECSTDQLVGMHTDRTA